MSMELPLRKARASSPARRSAAAGRSLFAWPFFSILLLTPLCLYRVWPHSATHHISDFFSHTLYQGFICLAAILMLWRAWRSGQKRLFWWPLLVSLGTFLCVVGLKEATHLPRPNGGHPDGFPSGHTTFSFALAWLLTQTHPRLAPLWFGLAVCIGWSRVDGLAHFPYQVLVGACLGTLIGWGISHRLKPPSPR